MKLETLNEILSELAKHDKDFKALSHLISLMHEAGDSNISFSHCNLGVNILKDTIDIVDIYEGESLAVLKLTIKGE